MTIYLYWHTLSAVLAMWLLIRTVSCSNVVGVVAMLCCAIFGPFALATLLAGAFLSINAEQSEIDRHNEDRRAHDPEFYKNRHDRRHK